MTPLIVMPEPLPGAGAADLEAVATHMPELPALTRMLARARRLPRTADWRSGTLAALLPAAMPVAPAAVAACAISGLRAGSGVSMVAPLHLVAGISRVHLPPGGRIQAPLEPWRQAFNAEFGSADLQLHAAGSGWVLAAPFAHAACDPAPEALAGPLARQPAADADLRSLRRLGAEVELWLAAHPLNREREQQQLPPLNTFWFWGGARAGARPAAPAVPRSIASPWPQDAWLAGLALHLGVGVASADDWSSLPPGAALVVLVPPADIAPAQYWQEMESRWLAPAQRALECGDIGALRLQLGGSAWRLPDRSPLRWLRRARPWYQQVQA